VRRAGLSASAELLVSLSYTKVQHVWHYMKFLCGLMAISFVIRHRPSHQPPSSFAAAAIVCHARVGAFQTFTGSNPAQIYHSFIVHISVLDK